MAKVTGKTVVFTGKLETMTRDEAAAKAKALGAKVGSAVTKDTDILIAGSGAGSTLKDAKKHGVKVIDEAAWVKMAGKPAQASIVQELPSSEIVGEEHADEEEGGNRISIELRMNWLEMRVGEISDGATTRIIAGEDYDTVIWSEYGMNADELQSLPATYFINCGSTFRDVAFNKNDLQKFKISINENEVGVGPGNILIIPLLNKDSPALDKLEEIGFVSIGKIADHVSNEHVIDQITHLFHAHKHQVESFYGPIIAKNKNIFVLLDGWKGCSYTVNYNSKSPISLNDVRIIFFAEDNFLAGLTNTSIQNEGVDFKSMKRYFKNIRVGSYLAAIYVGKNAVKFCMDEDRDAGLDIKIVKYTGEKRTLVYSSLSY